MIRTHLSRPVLTAIVSALAVGIVLYATTLRPNFAETQYVAGLSNPTAMAFAPDGRLFVCQQGGQLRVVDTGGQLLATPFLTVPVDASGERGLLGVAFDPDFANNRFVYVYYTATTPSAHNRISRFTANGNGAVAGSEQILLDLQALTSATNHNGGAMHFGTDGKLYVAVGDNANGANSQSMTTLLGKILRLNSDGTIPSDNPFFNTATGDNRAIWALGLRNPFTFSIDAFGKMFINDVGQNTWEEINLGAAGANYGWPASEGPTANPAYTSPIYSYQHTTGTVRGCAITGGAFYTGTLQQFPNEYAGDYFFADFCSNWINQLNDIDNGLVTPTFAVGTVSSPVDVQVGPDGALYYLSRGTGSTTGVVQRIVFSGPQAPSITSQPSSISVSAGQPASFTVGATGSTPLSYQWQRNTADITGANSPTYTIPAVSSSDNGAMFRAIVSNSLGSVTSDSATLTVTGNAAPVPTIVTPAAGTLYTAGTVLSFSGTATDAEDGTLAASQFAWQIDFHHDAHVHDSQLVLADVRNGTFAIPDNNETSANVFYRIILTVTDSAGQSVTVFRDVQPRTAQVTLNTSPTGFQLTLDGATISTPFTLTGVAGIRRTIGAPSPQVRQSGSYDFKSWSDGGAQTHVLVTPSAPTSVTATYRKGKR